MNNPNRRASDIGFFNDFTREYSQFAAFASVDFDILENLTLTLGTRYYDIENSMVGANMGSFYCKVYGTGESGPCTGDCMAMATTRRTAPTSASRKTTTTRPTGSRAAPT